MAKVSSSLFALALCAVLLFVLILWVVASFGLVTKICAAIFLVWLVLFVINNWWIEYPEFPFMRAPMFLGRYTYRDGRVVLKRGGKILVPFYGFLFTNLVVDLGIKRFDKDIGVRTPDGVDVRIPTRIIFRIDPDHVKQFLGRCGKIDSGMIEKKHFETVFKDLEAEISGAMVVLAGSSSPPTTWRSVGENLEAFKRAAMDSVEQEENGEWIIDDSTEGEKEVLRIRSMGIILDSIELTEDVKPDEVVEKAEESLRATEARVREETLRTQVLKSNVEELCGEDGSLSRKEALAAILVNESREGMRWNKVDVDGDGNASPITVIPVPTRD